jgi:hypothetical protein
MPAKQRLAVKILRSLKAIWVFLIIVLAAIGLTALVAAMIHRLFPAPMHDSVSLFCERERDS